MFTSHYLKSKMSLRCLKQQTCCFSSLCRQPHPGGVLDRGFIVSSVGCSNNQVRCWCWECVSRGQSGSVVDEVVLAPMNHSVTLKMS